jgi:hypothetical protein
VTPVRRWPQVWPQVWQVALGPAGDLVFDWVGKTVARFAFLHPHTSMDLVSAILDRMARDRPG